MISNIITDNFVIPGLPESCQISYQITKWPYLSVLLSVPSLHHECPGHCRPHIRDHPHHGGHHTRDGEHSSGQSRDIMLMVSWMIGLCNGVGLCKSQNGEINWSLSLSRFAHPIYQMRSCGATDLSTPVWAMTNPWPSTWSPFPTSTRSFLTTRQGKTIL